MSGLGGGAGAVDIGRVLDGGAWSGLQKTVAGLAALAVLLDGVDSQLMSFAIPVLIKQWHVTRADFALVVACGLVGMAIGSVCSGAIGDRFGRRAAILWSLLILGVATCAIGLADNLFTIGALRLVAGFGIGGALPCATTLTAEFTPARHRTLAVTATITCVPLGGMVAGLLAGQVLPRLDWRALFFIGGLLPVALCGLLLVLRMPESPRFLARHPARWAELSALLARMSRIVPQGAGFADIAEQQAERPRRLRRPVRRGPAARYAQPLGVVLPVPSRRLQRLQLAPDHARGAGARRGRRRRGTDRL